MKIAIAGYGVEGKANYEYFLKRYPDAEITIVDEADTPKFTVPESAKTLLGAGSFQRLSGYDLVLRTASLSPFKIKTDGKIWSATNEFFAECPAQIIGVTGTKGKGTTSSLIASILESSGKKVWLVGNIGIPALEKLPQMTTNDVVVFELSSFQLWDLERSPHVAVVLPIEAEHLDIHRDMEDYVQAKAHIRMSQRAGDICVFNPHNSYSQSIANQKDQGERIDYASANGDGVYVEGEWFMQKGTRICSVNALQLRGVHNQENACAAITVALSLGISSEAIQTGLKNFSGLPHRIEFVKTVHGVQYYNDSFSSSTPATIAAARSFTEPEIIIIGGIDRGGDFSTFAHELESAGNIKRIILIGDIRHKLADLFASTTLNEKVIVSDAATMAEIVKVASKQASPGDVVILSPGCASFDMFKDFSDRGNQFKQEVEKL